VASFFFSIKSVGRGAGRRATAAAAYRAGERLRDERSGKLYNYSHRQDVLHTEIFLPAHLGGSANAWAGNRERLWNMAEHAEKRSNSRVAREYQVTLPHELTRAQQIALARGFSRELAERYKIAVDLAVHLPRRDGDPRNFHAHLLTTTREVTPRGLAAKAGLDMHPRERRRRELPDSREEFRTLRERWATLTNEVLREANIDARVDHRSLAAQGIDREPQRRIPIFALKLEQRGIRSELAERIREDYRRRVQARLERAAQPGAVVSTADAAAPTPGELRDVDEIRRRAREAWLKTRERTVEPDALAQEAPGSTRGRDDDYGL
jgi:ATP-dependent exoDNAse (exonuclease V) alpha subunit